MPVANSNTALTFFAKTITQDLLFINTMYKYLPIQSPLRYSCRKILKSYFYVSSFRSLALACILHLVDFLLVPVQCSQLLWHIQRNVAGGLGSISPAPEECL